MSILATEYRIACTTPSDIHEHIPFLYQLAIDSSSIIEFGVRYGMSTRAFLYSNTPLISYDLKLESNIGKLFYYAKQHGNNVQYIQANTLDLVIDNVDLLFIDSLHTYDQLTEELRLHGNKANKYLAFHDTYSYGLIGEDGNKGLLQAIIEFIIKNPHWHFKYHFTNNNGLTVLQRSI
jgi:hypothetical protein